MEPVGDGSRPTAVSSRRQLLRAGVAAALLTTGACARDPGDGSAAVELVRLDRARSTPSGDALTRGATAVRAFTADLHRRTAAGAANAVSAPLSVAVALGMVRTGARGRTGSEIDDVLHVRGAEQADSGFNAVTRHLAGRAGPRHNASGEPAAVALQLADAVWAQRGGEWKPAYLEALARSYGTGIRAVDFRTDRAAVVAAVNTWVSRQTGGQIHSIVRRSDLDDLTRLVLVNALHLKAPWLRAFDRAATRPAPFHRARGPVASVPTMHTTTGLHYRESADWQAVDLPYAGSQLAMTVVLPRTTTTLGRLEAGLTGASLGRMLTGPATDPREVELALPTWAAGTTLPLAETLSAMGMPTAFSPRAADLSGMTDREQLFVSGVRHRARISVDEQGTEASAATAVTVDAAAAPAGGPLVVRVDRPYLFVVQDLETGCPLFIGHVTDPAERDPGGA